MSLLTAFILGIIQGFTEFLPISSSGHLALAQHLLGIDHLENLLTFDIVCHLGTLLAIFCLLSRNIATLLWEDKRVLFQLIFATFLLIPAALLSKQLAALFHRIDLLGFFFLVTASLLLLAHKFHRPASQENLQKRWWKDSLLIGAVQTFAVLPGVSRSGATISAARLLGWPAQEAVVFSFLLAIPAILGAALLETVKAQETLLASTISSGCYLIGFITSFAAGLLALWVVKQLVDKDKMHYFAWYCIFLGIFTIAATW